MTIDDFFTDDIIIRYLCDLRAKKAKQRSEKHLIHLISQKEKLNHHKFQTEEEIYLKKILPPRRKWKKLGKVKRYKTKWQKINSFDYNTKCIYITVKYYLHHYPNEPFVIALNDFIITVREIINSNDYCIQPPRIYPKHKKPEKKSSVCRPIAVYSIVDKLVISKTNAYLTKVFDSGFYDASYAFRATREVNKKQIQVNHHTAIEDILTYRKKYKGKKLYVAECDMSKFYDSVNHSVIKNQFQKKLKSLRKKGIKIDERAIHIFYSYLKSYNFIKNVLPLNKDNNFWEYKNFSKDCYFEWVEEELLQKGHYKRTARATIGIPQGGAISGFIANLVLDFADKQVLKSKDKKLLYIRFCDDMIIMHPYKYGCMNAIVKYENALLNLKLIPHEFHLMHLNKKIEFWDKKSKQPYKWSSNHTAIKHFPWIGFVGYEMHFTGKIRVRKSTLKKEIKKQKKVVHKIIRSIDNNNLNKRKGTVMESAIHRLIGMSVGRVTMWNHNNLENEMCWVNGFPELSDNKYLRKQLKKLDHYRNYQIKFLKKYLKTVEEKKPSTDKRAKKKYYGKPYSYYKQMLDT
ncbi:hypothetical protein LB467_17785 [Salegentibacter sp. JZCK2]|uniref:reverse transcriptase domain-containing protein n=1 Tax=Salegentibacter tibetensis TaxID=2873600 RepID=UPI001CC9FD8A|nr:reverse transcriptase domain-containing protein [Salegentibacter tibetensis]MBZ9731540.1 hypothetical protein [Salegentibacter tibetensis]